MRNQQHDHKTLIVSINCALRGVQLVILALLVEGTWNGSILQVPREGVETSKGTDQRLHSGI